jgi:hypothetical protein
VHPSPSLVTTDATSSVFFTPLDQLVWSVESVGRSICLKRIIYSRHTNAHNTPGHVPAALQPVPPQRVVHLSNGHAAMHFEPEMVGLEGSRVDEVVARVRCWCGVLLALPCSSSV